MKPEVTLGEYKGVEVEKSDVEVTEEDINKEVDRKANIRLLRNY